MTTQAWILALGEFGRWRSTLRHLHSHIAELWIKQGRGLYCSSRCAGHSPARVESAKRNLIGKAPDPVLNAYIVQQKDSGRTWSSLTRELGKAFSTIRDRYRWYKQNMEVSHVDRT